MKKITFIMGLVLWCFWAGAQSIPTGPIEFKDGRAAGNTAESKMKSAPKKIFINRFRVFYQVVYVAQETAKEGVNRGAASASLIVGFDGVNEKYFIDNTDRLFAQFTGMLKEAGFEIVEAEAAKDIKAFKGWTMVEGGQINSAQKQGMAMVSPTGFKYFAKEVLPSGKEKVSFFDPSGFASNQLGKIPSVNVDIFVEFMADSESGASKLASGAIGGIAKEVASPYLRVSAEGTKSNFNWAAMSVINTPMKDDLPINGVFQDEKFKAVATAVQNTSYNAGFYSYVVSEDVSLQNIQMAKCDIGAYEKGVADATAKYLRESTQLFLDFASDKK